MNSYVKLLEDIASEDEPIKLEDVKAQCRLSADFTAEDDYIARLITAARHAIEANIDRPIGEQTFEMGMCEWPYTGPNCDWDAAFRIEFPRPPLIAVETIKYLKANGTTVTWYDSTSSPVIDPQSFTVETGLLPGTIFLKSSQSWPIDLLEYGFPIKIQFRAGITDVRDDLKTAMLLMIAHLYENREPVVAERGVTPVEIPYAVKFFLQGVMLDDFR